MKPQTTIAFLIAFLVMLGVFAYMQYTHQPTTAEKIGAQARVLPELYNVAADHVTEVSIKRDSEELHFTHDLEHDQWQMKKPLDVLADASALRQIVNDLKSLEHLTLSGSKSDKGYGVWEVKNPTDLVQYNLDQPKTAVTITYNTREGKGRPATATLLVGGTVAGDDGLYVKLPDQDVVQAVRKTSLASLEKKLVEYREPKLVTTSRWNADRLALEWPDRKITAEKGDGKWRLVEPIADRGDRTKIEELIGKLTDLKAENRDSDFVDDNATDLAKYGLDQPALVAEIRKEKTAATGDDQTKDKSKEPEKPQLVQKVLIGKPVEGKDDKLYAMLDGQKYVVAVNAALVKDVDKPVNELRSHDLVEVTQFDVDYVRVDRAAGHVAIGKKDFDWEIYEPKTAKADTAAVTDIVKKIDEIEIKEFIDAGDPKDYGLDTPALTVSLYQKGLKPDDKDEESKDKEADKKEEAKTAKDEGKPEPKGTPIQVHFGKRDEEKKLIYAQRGGESGIFAVADDALWEQLDRGYLAYRDRKVLGFGRNDVAKLTVHRDGNSFTVERKKEKQGDAEKEVWRMTEPVDAPADSFGIDDVLFSFSNLTAKKLHSEGGDDLKTYGLDEPKIRATVTMKAEGDAKADQHVLLVGGEVDGGHYAKLGSADLVFSVDQPLVNYLNAELRDRSLLKFDSFKVEGLTLTWPDAKLELANTKPEGKTAKEWTVVGNDEFKLDPAKAQALVSLLANVTADRFVQYDGAFAEQQGLASPALAIAVKLEGESDAKMLRFGARAEGEKRYAAAADQSGPVALVPEDRFKDVLAGPGYFAPAAPPQPDPEQKPDAEKKPGDDSKPDAEKKPEAEQKDEASGEAADK